MKRNHTPKKSLSQTIAENRATITGMARLMGNTPPVFSEMSTDKKGKNAGTNQEKIPKF